MRVDWLNIQNCRLQWAIKHNYDPFISFLVYLSREHNIDWDSTNFAYYARSIEDLEMFNMYKVDFNHVNNCRLQWAITNDINDKGLYIPFIIYLKNEHNVIWSHPAGYCAQTAEDLEMFLLKYS